MRPLRLLRLTARPWLVPGVIMLTLLSLALLGRPRHARADTAPPPGLPATVSADGLPTVQINGIVWSQVTLGNAVYATGSFSSARPAGAAAGVGEVARGGLLEYNITTGGLISSFAHRLNGPGLTIAATPNGSVIYVGGRFTSVDGKRRMHLAAFSARTGALLSFAPNISAVVRSIYATNTTVFVGGDFTSANGQLRRGLASFTIKTGAVTSWRPGADGPVTAMIMSPRGNRLIMGGHFEKINGRGAYGIAAVDPVSGTLLAWTRNFPIRDAGPNAAITSFSTDGKYIYSSGYVYGSGGNFEGRFAFNPDNGALVWMNDCHGDTYDTYVVGQVLYSVGHSHDCSTIGGYGETSPLTNHRALAETTFATGRVLPNLVRGYANFAGYPHSAPLDWYPDLTPGSVTHSDQAAWSVTGNSRFIALGGEFTAVNGVPQQGLVRFAVGALAPNRQGPLASAALTPVATVTAPGTVQLSWGATWDRDNADLTYTVLRNGAPIYSTVVGSRFWSLPQLGFTDSGAAPGTSTYQIQVSDPYGNTILGSPVPVYLPSAVRLPDLRRAR